MDLNDYRARYNDYKEELIALLSEDTAIKTKDYDRTDYLLRELSSLLKEMDFEDEKNDKTTSMEVIVNNPS